MQSLRIIPIAVIAVGMFLLSLGINSLKVAHLGIQFLPVQWLATAMTLSYHTVGVVLVVLGFVLMLLAAEDLSAR